MQCTKNQYMQWLEYSLTSVTTTVNHNAIIVAINTMQFEDLPSCCLTLPNQSVADVCDVAGLNFLSRIWSRCRTENFNSMFCLKYLDEKQTSKSDILRPPGLELGHWPWLELDWNEHETCFQYSSIIVVNM